MNVINYNPTLVEENIARLKEETNEYNESEMRRKGVLRIIGCIFMVLCIVMITLMLIKEGVDGLLEIDDVIFLMLGLLSGLVAMTLFFVCSFGFSSVDIEYTSAMIYHLATHGKKVLDARFEHCDLDGAIVVFRIQENDNTVSTVKLTFDKIVEKTEIQEPEIDMEKEIVYIPYATCTNPWFC